MTNLWRGLALAWLLAVLSVMAGCATAPPPSSGSVVLLPNPQGELTAVTVTQGGRSLLLAQPYAAATLTRDGPQLYRADAQQVQAQFGQTLAAMPLPPKQFTLNFVEGTDELTAESKRVVDSVFDEITKRPLPDVVVIGHTDTVGSDAFNDRLSRQRAEVVRTALLSRGIAPAQILVVGRGKREPIVATGDGVAEARNRRVEIQVR